MASSERGCYLNAQLPAWPAPIVLAAWRAATMRVVAIDSHKATLAAGAVDELGQALAEATFSNSPAGFTALLAWLREHGRVERIGLEGSAGYGAAAARFLLGAGE